MKILFLHLSDIHLARIYDSHRVKVEKIADALNDFGEFDQCIIVMSGDISYSGKFNEFKVAGSMLAHLINLIKGKINNRWVNVVVVPGNHDLDLVGNERTFKDITDAYRAKTLKSLINRDLKSLNNFFIFARRNNCFSDNRIVCQRKIRFINTTVNFTLINSAIFSLCGSTNQDKGCHFLSSEDLDMLIPKDSACLNIAVMHHGYEWFNNSVKENLREIICNNFSIVFEGHEHSVCGEQRIVNNEHSIYYIQGHSLSGDKNHVKGFVAALFNTKDRSMTVKSFLWNNDYYKSKIIIKTSIEEKCIGVFRNNQDFLRQLKYDSNNKLISQYFVFPSMSYSATKDGQIDTLSINDPQTLYSTIMKQEKVIITGDSKMGKSTLAKVLYNYILEEDKGIPILLISEELHHKKLARVLEIAFKDQYSEHNNSYDKFLQLNKQQRILIIDDADKIKKLDNFIEFFDSLFGRVIIFSEENINLNIRKQVVNELTENNFGHLCIKPFLYKKRKELITKVCSSYSIADHSLRETVTALNNVINNNLKYFKLDPGFIINFVSQYMTKEFSSATSSNIFSIVYENSIKEKLINCVEPKDIVDATFKVISELAYFAHFKKLTWISFEDIVDVVKLYNKEFRQNINGKNFVQVCISTKILIEKGSSYKFRDNSLLAYFVAQALNTHLYYEEDSEETIENVKHILKNLCFGINSDIILFIAFITNNPKIINIILQSAYQHFNNKKELSFDLGNIAYLNESKLDLKDKLPDDRERDDKETILDEFENEELKNNSYVEVVDNYDYDENEIEKFYNQIITSIKFLEIVSKTLPAFSHNMKTRQQDKIVSAIYSFPNRFLYQYLVHISNNFDAIVQDIYSEITAIKKEKNTSDLHIKRVKEALVHISTMLIVNLYQLVANTAATDQTIHAINAFDISNNSNHAIMNLMMVGKTSLNKEFREKAVKIFDDSNIELVKSMVRYTVRNFFLEQGISIVGENQSLLDKFFPSQKTLRNKIKFETGKQIRRERRSHI